LATFETAGCDDIPKKKNREIKKNESINFPEPGHNGDSLPFELEKTLVSYPEDAENVTVLSTKLRAQGKLIVLESILSTLFAKTAVQHHYWGFTRLMLWAKTENSTTNILG